MPENLLNGQGATLLMAIMIVGIALLALVGVFWLIRNRAASTFIRGGKNRLPRLAVLDATAVDTRRRLVLIRRDDVEHLVMIGGPTDIVIESGIPQAHQGRAPQQAEPAMPAPQQQRTAPPAPQQQRMPASAPAPSAAAATSVDRAPRQPDTGSRPSPRPHQPPQAPLAAAVAPVGAAATIRTEAADLLETARTRVFEEPDFDERDLEDLMAVPQSPARPAPQASAPSRPAPVSQPASAPSRAVRPSPEEIDPIQSEAADVLETVRTRMFEEPSFDEDAFDELTADTGSNDRARAQATAPDFSRATLTGSPHVASPEATPAPASSDFEAVLAAELSEDPTLGSPQENFITAHYNEHQLTGYDNDPLQAPEVKPEPQPSRDSLEAEMEKLLGDLSRKP